MQALVKYDGLKKQEKIKNNFMSFVKHVWPEFIQGSHHKE